MVATTGVDPADTVEPARLAAREAGRRAGELRRRLADPAVPPGSTTERVAAARRRADTAATRAAAAVRRSIDAQLSAARAHEHTALVHVRKVEAGGADAEYHRRRAEEHRRAAEAARRAAEVQRRRIAPE